jgi:hypothetical protein
MTAADLIEVLEFNRKRTLGLLDEVAKREDARAALGWRPGPGRAHLAWQLMHLAATDDRHVHARMRLVDGEPQQPEYVRRFAGGSVPDDDIPALDEIRGYLQAARDLLLTQVRALDAKAFETKPNDQAPWTIREWLKVLAWHEAHHQGQAHLTFNLYRAAHDPAIGKGHA